MVVNKNLHSCFVGFLTIICFVILALPSDLKLISLGENYLPIHTFMEMVGMLLCFSVFIAGWATYRDLKSQKLLILSITSLAVGFFDFGHSLSFPGMPEFFSPNSPTKSIYFWCAGRLTDCLAFLFLASPWFNLTNFKKWRWSSLFVVMTWTFTCYFLILTQEDRLPVLYSFESGLTPLKIYIEWAISGVFLGAGVLFTRQSLNPQLSARDSSSSHLMAMASVLFALAGLFFSFYRSIDDLYNLIGHLYKAIGLGYVYRAVFIDCIRLPYYEMKKSAAEAQTANAAKSRFLANVSHEFRTPLGIISGYGELLAEKPLDPESQDWVSTIRRSSVQLRYLVDDLLDLTKAENEKISLSLKTFAIHGFKMDLLQEMRLLAEKKQIELKCGITDNFPERITTDPVRLRQILVNILGNAIKFTHHGGVYIQFSYLEDERFQISVRDTGLGIESEKRSLLFKPFSQLDDSYTRQFGGTGLGLALSKKLSQLLGGDLWLESSERDQGSTFVVSIKDFKTEATAFETPRPTRAKALTNLGRFQNLRILIAEDSYDIQALIRLYLKETQAQLTVVDNGQEAVTRFNAEDFDLIIMDIQMPKLDGLQAARLIRATGWSGPIMALTAHAHESEKERVLNAGFDHYVTKPFKKDFLIQKISEASNP